MILVIIAAIYRLSNNNLIKLMFFIVFDRTKYVADWWNSIFRRQRRPKHFVTHMAHIVCECALFLCDAIINTCHSLWFLFLFEYFWNKTTPWQKKKISTSSSQSAQQIFIRASHLRTKSSIFVEKNLTSLEKNQI